MTAPGVLLVWSGSRPHGVTVAIPPEGLVLGRELLQVGLRRDDDDRISRHHARVKAVADTFTIQDLLSRNGTFVDAEPLYNSAEEPRRAAPFTVLRTGRSVWLLVPDVARYTAMLWRDGRLVVGASLAGAHRTVTDAARERVHLALCGPINAGFGLARVYAKAHGGRTAWFEARGPLPLRELVERTHARVLVIELVGPLEPADRAYLDALPAELRVVTATHDARWLATIPPALRQRQLALPDKRYDEIATTVADLVRDGQSAIAVHPTVIERCLINLRERDEDTVLAQVREAMRGLPRGTELRGKHLLDASAQLERLMLAPRPLGERASKPDEPAEASWHHRRLCRDGACVGVIVEGTCGVCGQVEPLGDPYR